MAKSCGHLADLGRRSFLGGSGVFAAAGVATAVGATVTKADVPLARVNYPSQKLGNVKDLKVDEPKDIATSCSSRRSSRRSHASLKAMTS